MDSRTVQYSYVSPNFWSEILTGVSQILAVVKAFASPQQKPPIRFQMSCQNRFAYILGIFENGGGRF
ncbi:MAG: hypothetical protein PF495_10260, partial [Spirochaetales bacterium]|nr:hypothetical protein [Spirochaetales bacterium]